ncbi:MAG: MFS transporter [Actinomycetota bacterium]
MSNGDDTGASRRAWLTPTLVLVTGISLLQDAASELLYPLLPIFLTGVLAAPPVVLGVVEGLADATSGFVRYWAGRWSDRRGRKGFIASGYGLAALGKVAVAAASSWPMVLLGRMGDRVGKGLRSAPRDALIASATPTENLGRAFGFHRMGDSLGAVIGPLLGLVALAVVEGDVRAAMWWAVVPGILSAVLTLFIREPAALVHTSSPAEDHIVDGDLPSRYRRVVTVLVVISLVNFSDALLLLRVLDLGFSTTEVVAAYVLFNAVYTLASYPAGVLSDRWPKRMVYAAGLVAFSVGYLGLGFVSGGAPVYVFVALYGLFPAFTDGVGKAWIATLVPKRRLGRAQGLYQALNNGAILVAGLWAGLLWNVGSGAGRVPLLVSGAVGAFAAVFVGSGMFRRYVDA